MDSNAVQSLATNPHVSARNKHIDPKTHHVRELIQRNLICLSHVTSLEQPADLLTKIMSPQTLRQMVALLRLADFWFGSISKGRFTLIAGILIPTINVIANHICVFLSIYLARSVKPVPRVQPSPIFPEKVKYTILYTIKVLMSFGLRFNCVDDC